MLFNIIFFKLQYTQAMLHSIQNADGTVSIIQVDPNNQIITLPDGTTAQVQGIATVTYSIFVVNFDSNNNNNVFLQLTQGDGGGTVHTVQSIDAGQDNMTVDLTEATLGQDGQIIITGEDGQGEWHTYLCTPKNSKLLHPYYYY